MRTFDAKRMRASTVVEDAPQVKTEVAPPKNKGPSTTETLVLIEMRNLVQAIEAGAKIKPDPPVINIERPNVHVSPPIVEFSPKIEVNSIRAWDAEVTERSADGRIRRIHFRAVEESK